MMEDTAQREIDLQKKVGESLGVSPEKLKPEDQSPLQKLAETGAEVLDVIRSRISSVGEKLGGEVDHIRVTETSKPSFISRLKTKILRTKIKIWK